MFSFLKNLFNQVKQEPIEVKVTVRVVFENTPNLSSLIDKKDNNQNVEIKTTTPVSKSVNNFEYDLGEPIIVKNLGKETK
jgi:hypothetical protein